WTDRRTGAQITSLLDIEALVVRQRAGLAPERLQIDVVGDDDVAVVEDVIVTDIATRPRGARFLQPLAVTHEQATEPLGERPRADRHAAYTLGNLRRRGGLSHGCTLWQKVAAEPTPGRLQLLQDCRRAGSSYSDVLCWFDRPVLGSNRTGGCEWPLARSPKNGGVQVIPTNTLELLKTRAPRPSLTTWHSESLSTRAYQVNGTASGFALVPSLTQNPR